MTFGEVRGVPEYLQGNNFILDHYQSKWPMKASLDAFGRFFNFCGDDDLELD